MGQHRGGGGILRVAESAPRTWRPGAGRSRRRGLTSGTFVLAALLLVVSAGLRPDVAVSLVLLGAAFTVIEWWRPLRLQAPAFRREGAATDACAFVVDQVLVAAALATAVLLSEPVVDRAVPDVVPEVLGAQAGWVRWVLAFVLAELCGYWIHRLSHESPVLWRFHAVHHSAPQMDWLAPSRRHPVDALVSAAATTFPVLLLGLSPPAVVSVFALRRIQGLLLHANLDLRLGLLERIVATPFFHHWHHTSDPGRWDCNYAGSVPAVDWIFGTLDLPETWPDRYGCDVEVPATGYVARFLSPWRRNPRAVGNGDGPPAGAGRADDRGGDPPDGARGGT